MIEDNGHTSTGVHTGGEIVERLSKKLDRALDALDDAKPFAKSTYQTDIFQIAETLLETDGGLRALYERAHRFDATGVFLGGPWAEAARLQPPLVAGSLKAAGVYPVVEILSELRVLAIAKGRVENPAVSREDATDFLNEVLALNLEFVFPADTEQERTEGGPRRDFAIRLFALLATELELTHLRAWVIEEIEQICAQRPIMTDRVRRMIELASRIPEEDPSSDESSELRRFADAISGPSPLSRVCETLAEYRDRLASLDAAALETEARDFAEAMRGTGLTCPQHAVLLRHLRARNPELIADAMALNDVGRAELAQNQEFAHRLLRAAILPATAQGIYGFAKVLERGVLSRNEVQAGLTRLVTLDFQSQVRQNLLARRPTRDGATANSILVAGAMSAIGQPLGIGQGRNPTCQAARAISLWAQHAPGHLTEMIVSAARDGFVEFKFEGTIIRSNALSGLATQRDMELDAVSIVLVPHLDAVYEEMMKLVALRQEDGHKWVNPALYGRWVPNGFASVFADVAQTTVRDYADFVRRFYATHHPAYNEGHTLMFPNPVGICVTNGHGDYLGPHAVTIQRVAEDPLGELRVYFYNPNNEGRQDWGQEVKPTVGDNGEREGESSLPFHQFVSRLYAFHYNPYEEGDAYAVLESVVAEIEAAARGTWGRAFTWMD